MEQKVFQQSIYLYKSWTRRNLYQLVKILVENQVTFKVALISEDWLNKVKYNIAEVEIFLKREKDLKVKELIKLLKN